jgi:hypothetical protein
MAALAHHHTSIVENPVTYGKPHRPLHLHTNAHFPTLPALKQYSQKLSHHSSLKLLSGNYLINMHSAISHTRVEQKLLQILPMQLDTAGVQHTSQLWKPLLIIIRVLSKTPFIMENPTDHLTPSYKITFPHFRHSAIGFRANPCSI